MKRDNYVDAILSKDLNKVIYILFGRNAKDTNLKLFYADYAEITINKLVQLL